ncbi:DUF364 domain-containing protein [Desulfoscipio gibsoniae]|uniref:Heavy-metal chelation domain-containing protein n=1 Tax=Desulfoscipio gibsoniae DSM 7213 TaxID=767817 RepID=R4KRA1_9FIRM|nr:DUF364 domain-containing protein [Desulfoscipio gibsoniae]AGL03095.1 hypothetical protein Desgi_3773 [Desulfoscipio gibsoniae DSM 7213]
MWKIYDELIESVPRDLMVSDCCVGLHWILVKSKTTGVAMTPKEGCGLSSMAGDIVGMSVRELAGYIKSWNNLEAAVALAAINSAINTKEQVERMTKCSVTNHQQTNAFTYYSNLLSGKKVAVIGRFPDLDQLKNICEISVLERRPGPDDFPDPACEFLLPQQDYVFITATTLINKTLPRLLQLAGKSKVILVGPSTPLTPRLFAYGISALAGSVITDAKIWSFVRQGGGGMAIFEHGCNMVKISSSEIKNV